MLESEIGGSLSTTRKQVMRLMLDVISIKTLVATLSCFSVLAAFALPLPARQSCPSGDADLHLLASQMKTTDDPNVIFRSAAIGEMGLAQQLKSLAREEMIVLSVPGAAQTALAKLGDTDSLSQLRSELGRPSSNSIAVPKLARVNNEEAVTILMDYVVSRSGDSSRLVNFGDTTYDPLVPVEAALSSMVVLPPIEPNGDFSTDAGKWKTWWEHRKSRRVTLELPADFQDPRLQCFVRKIQWGFPDAVLDLGEYGGPKTIPLLKKLTQVGVSVANPDFQSMKGRAQTELAKLGDLEELGKIHSQLDTTKYADAVEKLQYIGGKDAVAAFVSELANPHFLSGEGIPKLNIKKYSKDKDHVILRALAKMVVEPPVVSHSRDVRQWKIWWAKNKDTAVFVKPPAKSYE